MASKIIKSCLAAAPTILMPAVAFAHIGVGDTSGFVHGFGHPISGLDHIIAMAMVGVFAWQLGGRALWLVPATFVSVMAVAGALGIGGIGFPFVETGIALSVVVLGATVAFNVKAPDAAAMGLAAFLRSFTVTLTAPRFQRMLAESPMLPASRSRRLCCIWPGLPLGS